MLTPRPDLNPCTTADSALSELIDLRATFRRAGYPRLFSRLALPIHHLFAIQRINTLYRSLPAGLPVNEFCRKSLDALGIDYALTETEIARIPTDGPSMVVSNHPFGGLEGIILAEVLLQVRGDVRILANHLLTRIPELAPMIIPVDPFHPGLDGRNVPALREALRWLKGGGAVLAFPAGEVSHWRPGGVADPSWSPHVVGLARTVDAKVLPVFVHGHNSFAFQVAGLVHPRLRTLMLPRELFNKEHGPIEVNIGHAIPYQRLADFGSDREAVDFLRFHTCLLRHRRERQARRIRPPRIRPRMNRHRRPVLAPVPKSALEREVRALPPENCLAAQGGFQVFLTMADESPAVMREIGRLREISFRDVDEGTGRSLDIDRYDRYYLQLFLWNGQTGEIAGAYRIGRTDRILSKLGPQGLYSASLFDYESPFMGFLDSALELGRSFIRVAYQKKFGCLTLLWRGIGELVARNPDYRYLFGPVSISRNYHHISKNLMVEFLSRHMLEPGLAAMVRPRCPLKVDTIFRRGLLCDCAAQVSLADISMLVAEIEKDRKGIPVLVKHYLKLNGRFLAFNVDKAFADVIDGLVFVDLLKTNPKILQRFLGKQGIRRFYSHHAQVGTLAA